jgi:hypothetical protein
VPILATITRATTVASSHGVGRGMPRPAAASDADGSRRSVVRADTIDPVAVAARWLSWRHPSLARGEETFYSLSVGNNQNRDGFHDDDK